MLFLMKHKHPKNNNWTEECWKGAHKHVPYFWWVAKIDSTPLGLLSYKSCHVVYGILPLAIVQHFGACLFHFCLVLALARTYNIVESIFNFWHGLLWVFQFLVVIAERTASLWEINFLPVALFSLFRNYVLLVLVISDCAAWVWVLSYPPQSSVLI